MSNIQINQAGMLSLLQDLGRFGAHHLGLTTGGPADKLAFCWANRLCSNALNATAIEITVGGFEFIAQGNMQIALTGAEMPLTINGQAAQLWRSYHLQAGDTVQIGFASQGMRAYLAVAGGFNIQPQFGSTATVCREGIGGINGQKLNAGEVLAINEQSAKPCQNLVLAEQYRPKYESQVTLRTVLGYQQQHFSAITKKCFFSSEYTVSERCDRMGYRLTGEKVAANIEGILSEGICAGAIQVPADGQPIVLLNDRQTIGGYPKIGSVISLDTAKLTQTGQGAQVSFEEISMEEAHNLNHLAHYSFINTPLQQCD